MRHAHTHSQLVFLPAAITPRRQLLKELPRIRIKIIIKMPTCVVKSCRNTANNAKKRHGITFHRFPNNEARRNEWTRIIRESRNESGWNPNKASVICSLHFDEDDLYSTKGGLLRVYLYAVPKNFLFAPPENQDDQPNSKPNYCLLRPLRPKPASETNPMVSGQQVQLDQVSNIILPQLVEVNPSSFLQQTLTVQADVEGISLDSQNPVEMIPSTSRQHVPMSQTDFPCTTFSSSKLLEAIPSTSGQQVLNAQNDFSSISSPPKDLWVSVDAVDKPAENNVEDPEAVLDTPRTRWLKQSILKMQSHMKTKNSKIKILHQKIRRLEKRNQSLKNILKTSKEDNHGPGPSQSPVPQDFGDDSEETITDHEDFKAEVVVKAEPVSGDEENSAEGSFKELQSPLRANYTSTYPQTLYTQPTTSTTPFIKIEVDNYKEDFLKLQQEIATLKAENQNLNARNHYLAQEIFKLKQTSHVLGEHDAIKDTHSIDNDLSHLAKESNRLSEKISEYADKIQKITSKYEIHEKTMDIDRNALENLDLTDKLRRLIEENKNIIGERDELKDKVQSLLVDLKNVSEENKTLTRYVKLQRKRIEMLRILCVSKTKNLKRLEKSCFKLKSMFSKLKMARQDF